ncbi:MAG TPA: hypothetical protein VGO93_15135 [Candidatus Xenobia bacterium]|jgi:hypothetical protein
MPEFFDNQVFGVRRLGSNDGGKTIMSDLALPSKKSVATLQVDVLDTKFQLLRALNLPFVYPVKAQILDANDRPVASMEKPFSLSEYKVTIQDRSRRVCGLVTRSVTDTGVDKGTFDYRIVDPTDQAFIAIIRGNWRKAGMMQVVDERGATIGKVSRTDNAMGSSAVSDPKFHVVNCYAPPQSGTQRLALMATAAALDVLVD